MTFCVAIIVSDCIVFAADSASTVIGPGIGGGSVVSNVWQHGIKVFNLHKKLPIAAMTAGMGNFGPISISNLAKDLRIVLSNENSDTKIDESDYTIEYVATCAQRFIEERYRNIDVTPANPHSFEFWVGGYGAKNVRGEVWKITISDGEILPLQDVAPEESMVIWGGQTNVLNRLIIGLDMNLQQILIEEGISQEKVVQIFEKFKNNFTTPLVQPSMPVQDAINLADFLVDVTKRYFAFLPGADIVGGNTDIATVTRHEGFKWIKRKHYYPADLNPKETDHVI